MSAVSVALGFLLTYSLPSVAGVDGRTHNLSMEAHGRPVALVFISHDCPICNAYAPEFGRIASEYAHRVLIAFVYAEPDLGRKQAIAHARAYGLSHAELLLDPNGRLSSACKARVTPEAAVFDATGRPVYIGRIDDRFYDFGKQRTSPTRRDFRLALDSVLTHKSATPAAEPPFGCVIETANKQ